VIFDFGNVIGFFDHHRAIAKFTRFTDVPAVELALALYGSPIEDDYEIGKLTTAEYVREAKLNGRINCSDQKFLEWFCDIFWRNEEVCDLIPKLKPKYRLVLASNTNDAHFGTYTRQFADVLKHFDALVPSHQAGSRKPHDEYFAYAQKYAGADPGECLFVDDLPVNIEAAARHGWKGVVYTADGTLAGKLRENGIQFNYC
jgi:putative hydrolase of the HAD superfamily